MGFLSSLFSFGRKPKKLTQEEEFVVLLIWSLKNEPDKWVKAYPDLGIWDNKSRNLRICVVPNSIAVWKPIHIFIANWISTGGN